MWLRIFGFTHSWRTQIDSVWGSALMRIQNCMTTRFLSFNFRDVFGYDDDELCIKVWTLRLAQNMASEWFLLTQQWTLKDLGVTRPTLVTWLCFVKWRHIDHMSRFYLILPLRDIYFACYPLKEVEWDADSLRGASSLWSAAMIRRGIRFRVRWVNLRRTRRVVLE